MTTITSLIEYLKQRLTAAQSDLAYEEADDSCIASSREGDAWFKRINALKDECFNLKRWIGQLELQENPPVTAELKELHRRKVETDAAWNELLKLYTVDMPIEERIALDIRCDNALKISVKAELAYKAAIAEAAKAGSEAA
jgi:hypothetical protein